jgi:Mn2+/Fe2+ NRAMP family transporter
MQDKQDPLDQLELPKTDLRSIAQNFGPGLILMMTGIGTSHLVTAPAAGGRFEYALLWCIPVAYIFKYSGFEMAFRFTHATGRSMLDAYATAPKKWPIWYVLITTLLQCALGQAGRLAAASAVVYYFFSQYWGFDTVPLGVYGVVLGVASVTLILVGRYAALELATKILAAMLFLSTVAVYFAEPAPVSALGRFFLIETPEGSWLVIAAFLGLLPTGIDVSLQASEWGKAKRVGMGRIRSHLEQVGLAPQFDPLSSTAEDLRVDTTKLSSHAREYCRRWFRIGEWDFAIGHLVSFVMAVIFLLLSAVWLYPNPVEGNNVIGEIAGVFTRSVGPGMMLVFLLGAFAATFSTAFNYFDGWPRVVGACCRNLFRATADLSGIGREDLDVERRTRWYSEYNIYRITMLYSLVASVALLSGLERPVYLVLVASALALFVAPVVYFLNLYYCVTVISKTDDVFYPSLVTRWFAWTSLVVFSGLSLIVILARVFDVTLFG